MWKHLDFYTEPSAFWAHLRWLNSGHVPLALADSQEDSRRMHMDPLPQWEDLSLEELNIYQRQLFMWRLLQMNFTFNTTFGNTPFRFLKD